MLGPLGEGLEEDEDLTVRQTHSGVFGLESVMTSRVGINEWETGRHLLDDAIQAWWMACDSLAHS